MHENIQRCVSIALDKWRNRLYVSLARVPDRIDALHDHSRDVVLHRVRDIHKATLVECTECISVAEHEEGHDRDDDEDD